jgi:hypothetical protein
VEVLLLGAGKRLGEALEEELVLAEAHGGDVGEAIIFVDEVGVRVRGVEAAGEDVEQGDGVAGGEPGFDGKSEGEGCVVAVGGEDEDVQVRLQWWFDCLRLGAVGEAWLPGFVGLRLERK